MTWWKASSVTVTAGQSTVTVNTGDDVGMIKGAEGLVIGNQPPVEVKRSYLNASVKMLELISPWPYATQSGQPAVAFPTDGDLAAATAVLKALIDNFYKASTVQAQAGTDDNGFMTSLKTKQAIDINAVSAATANTIPKRTATGSLKTATPAADDEATPRIYVLDAERRAVERASGGRQTVIYDNSGNASVMYVLPVFRYEELGLTASMGTGIASAFDVGTGSHKPEVFIGAYHASLVSGKACSVPFADAAASINFDNAKTACTSKGTGWHLMTMHEWAAIALWCEANGFVPRGNTNYGRAHDRVVEYGRRQDGGLPGDATGTARIRAGSGPATWRHDGTLAGISDLVGNVWEWQDGLSLVDGRIKASTFNTQAEASWALQAAYLNAVAGVTLSDALTTTASTNTPWATMPKSGGYVTNQLLKRLLVEPAGSALTGRIYQQNSGERLPCRGGRWIDGSDAGLGSLRLNFTRADTGTLIGFRAAFVG
ncbi:hypothetical protein [Rheinheimera soli]|uniref:Sulfatase-modifying factor enzyme domain-containing protein n=1 Tax=Rheinheimera soli TaxID=443616 RepID=A0ABU1VVL5_9GAMM|nr:hypothetical protein [Rheinheimera soli]MDR7119771.1 hypothetical protein [Rheinheimera soli]